MSDTLRFPFYAKMAFTLISLIAIFVILYFGQNIIIPVLMAILFAILLSPLKNFLEKKLHFPHVIASIVTLTLFVAFIAAVIFFLSWQISDMASDWGKIKANLNFHIANLQEMVRDNFNLSKREQNKLINKATADPGQFVGSTLMSVSDTLLNITLVFIYTFLMLLYRAHFIKFLCKLFKKEHHPKLQEIIGQIKVSVQSYIMGLFIEMLLVSALTTFGFMIIGVEYAFLLGAITGILNLIPYIGILFAGMLSIVASLSGSPDLSIVVGVIVVNIVVQFIDNNFLVPLIVSSKVEINALVSIVGIIVGGTLGGFAGMFLAIPLIAILKVIFDRLEEFSPWGYLMGDDMPKTYQWHRIKLPFYHIQHDSHAIVTESESPKIVFTEPTTTTTTTLQQEENKPQSE